MIVKMIQNLRNRMEARIEKIQEMFNKDLEELKNKQTEMNSTITEMKNGIDEPVCKAEIETQMQRTNVWTPKGERGMNWEIGIDIYTPICIKQITNKNLLYKNKIKFQKKGIYPLFIIIVFEWKYVWKYVNINVSDII